MDKIKRKQIEADPFLSGSASFRFFTDATSIPVASGDVYRTLAAGTGAAVLSRSVYSPTAITWGGGECGIYGLALGTTATGSAAYITPNPQFVLGFGAASFISAIKFATLSVAASRYVFRAGFLGGAPNDPVDGVYFRYVDNVFGGSMQCVCRAGGVETAFNTAQVITAIAYNLEIRVNATATSVQFFMSGSLVATITTNIPKVITRPVGFGVSAIRSTGTAATTPVEFDYIDVQCILARI